MFFCIYIYFSLLLTDIQLSIRNVKDSFLNKTLMANNSSHFSTVRMEILIWSVVFKFIAMIIGVLGNITVIIYTIFTSKERTATSYLVGNLALADLLVCLTFYPVWMIEFIQTILNIDSDQDIFCKLSRSTIWAFLVASVSTLLAITVDRYFYVVKPLRYPLIVTKRRVLVAMSGIWLTACCVFVVLLVYYRKFNETSRSLCYVDPNVLYFTTTFAAYFPLTLILILNIWILIVAKKQRKRILAETRVAPAFTSANKTSALNRLFHALKTVKTFSIVVAMLVFCILTPTVVGLVLIKSLCSNTCLQLWFVVFNYEFYGVNSIINAFIYGMRHIKYRKAYGHILFQVLRCNKITN